MTTSGEVFGRPTATTYRLWLTGLLTGGVVAAIVGVATARTVR